MKKLSKNVQTWIYAFLLMGAICFLVIFISEGQMPTVFTSSGIVAILSAIIGVLLTVIVTNLLLNKQSESEEEKEKSVKVFEEKLKIYQQFLDKLQEVIKDDRITEGEVKELIFQISTIAMHTKPEYVNPILKELEELVKTLENKNGNGDEQNEKPFYSALAGHIRKIVLEFQKELYPQIDKAGKDTEIDVAKFDDLVQIISQQPFDPNKEDLLKDLDDLTVKSIMEQLDKALEAALKGSLQGEGWEFYLNSAEYAMPRFYLGRKSWREKDYIGISYEGQTKAFFRAHSQDNPLSRDLYLDMRRSWGGRLNGYNWYMQFKDEYNDLSQIIEACKKSDSGLIDYIIDILVRTAEYMDAYQNLYKLYEKVTGNTGTDKVWIWKTHCVVNDFPSKIAIDTELHGGKWSVVLFAREDESAKQRVRKIVEENNSLFEERDEDGRYVYKDSAIDSIEKAGELTIELAEIVKTY